MKTCKLLLSIIFILAVMSFKSANAQSNKNLVVLVKYKTQPGNESTALIALKNLVAKVKKEPNYVTIIIHVDPNDKSNILLYEQWSDENYYKGEHMKTVHLQQFMTDARLFLAGPPEITFWKPDN